MPGNIIATLFPTPMIYYKTNEIGLQRARYVRKEALKMFIIGPIYSLIMMMLSYFSMMKSIKFFYAFSPLLILLMIFYFILAPMIMLRRHNRTINQIRIEDDNITIIVFSALWMKSKEYQIKRNALKIRKTYFEWYGKEKKEGIIFKNNKEYYLVFDYFDQFTELEKLLV